MSLFDDLKRLVSRRAGAQEQSMVPARPIEHPVLGSLQPDDRFPTSLAGRVAFGSGFVAIRIDPDGTPIDDALALASSAVESLAELDAKCRNLIAEDSLGGYNSDWRFGETINPDGSRTTFEKPKLVKSEFCAKLQFESLEVTGQSTLTFWYGDDDMFWGHSVYVDSFDGIALTDAHVSMFG